MKLWDTLKSPERAMYNYDMKRQRRLAEREEQRTYRVHVLAAASLLIAGAAVGALETATDDDGPTGHTIVETGE